MDPDANQLARTYIDNVEGLLRSNSRIHVNEIDSLLSEINDYVHLRCRELSKGDSVHYREVLEAIDECGSPSEIVKQYFEINSTELEKPFKPIKAKSAPIFSKKRIGNLIPSIRTKSPKNVKSNKIISAKSFSSTRFLKNKSDDLRYLTHSYYKKYEYKKKVETWIFLSCISIIGALWVPFLAFYWLVSLRNAESKFMKSWAENKAFSSVFPYQPEFFSLFTQNRTYQTNLLRINRIKTLFMVILIIPFLGYYFLLVGSGIISLITLGMFPLLAYYYLKGPKRHINHLIEREYQLQSEDSNNSNYLAFYNKSGYLSFDFDITTKIMREIKLSKAEKISGVFQKEPDVKIIGSSFLIITNEQIIDYSPPIFYDYREKIQYVPKKQLDTFTFRKKGRKTTLTVESIDGVYFIFRGLSKKVVEPIQNSLNLLGLKQEEPVIEHIKKVKMKNGITNTIEPFFCQVCESHQPNETASLICDTCSRAICINCFCQMARVGETNCPKCEGNLIAH